MTTTITPPFHRFAAACVTVLAAASAGLCSPAATRRAVGTHSQCSLLASSYHPSALEETWLRNADAWASKFCSHMDEFNTATQHWLDTIKIGSRLTHAPPAVDASIFSRISKEYDCAGRRRVVDTWIEPLSHGLRHPNALCKRGANLTDRDYLLLPFAQDLAARPRRCRDRRCQVIFMDLGASTWTAGTGGPSQSWFYESYGKHGITFDRLLLWEAKVTPPADVFGVLPKQLWHKYQYFNVPAVADGNDPSAPLNILKTVAQPDDFVVLKVDIDSPAVESKIIDTIIADPDLSGLVDELYYEYHVDFEPMNKDWFGWPEHGKITTAKTLKDAYDLFLRLRMLGIRAHSWI